MRRRQADLKAHVFADRAGIAQPLEDLPRGEGGFVVARLERDLARIDAWLEAHLVDLAHHLALEIDPARALAGLAVRHAAEVRPQLLGETAEHLLAAVERDAANQMQALTG